MNRLTLYCRKFKRNLCDYGFPVAVKKSLFHLLRLFYENRVYRIYTIRLMEWKSQTETDDRFEFRFIGPEDRQIIGQIEAMEEWLTGRVSEKLTRGGLCLVALSGDSVAGFNLVAFKEVHIPLVSLTKRLSETDAWSEQITVNRAYRRSGLGTKLRQRVFQELQRRGIKRLSGGSLVYNMSNLQLTRKVGFREIADIHYTNWIGAKKYKCVRIREARCGDETGDHSS